MFNFFLYFFLSVFTKDWFCDLNFLFLFCCFWSLATRGRNIFLALAGRSLDPSARRIIRNEVNRRNSFVALSWVLRLLFPQVSSPLGSPESVAHLPPPTPHSPSSPIREQPVWHITESFRERPKPVFAVTPSLHVCIKFLDRNGQHFNVSDLQKSLVKKYKIYDLRLYLLKKNVCENSL